jgi:hypothetical protein
MGREKRREGKQRKRRGKGGSNPNPVFVDGIFY